MDAENVSYEFKSKLIQTDSLCKRETIPFALHIIILSIFVNLTFFLHSQKVNKKEV